MNDKLLRQQVIDQLDWDGERVILDGTVDCWRDRDLVERPVWAAPASRRSRITSASRDRGLRGGAVPPRRVSRPRQRFPTSDS